ncbi:MAG TPA: FMN-binding negative transcriptional regulator [Terracidiphilus sp.]|nr:FMN-binding negative transcriptional regulator [Terracidiphilus sp.]
MYSPKFNRVDDRGILLEAMRAYSFATVFGPVSAGPVPVGLTPADPTSPEPPSASATHLPLVVKDEGEHGVIEGHFAKANHHWQALAGRETLVVFSGPHSYVSPTLYTEELSVPTWNYIAVHAYGVLELIEDPEAKDALLKDLIAIHEPAYADRWRALPEGFHRTMLAGIVGFRIPIARIEGKFKLSQNRKEAERANVRAALAAGDADQQGLAAWMQRLGG